MMIENKHISPLDFAERLDFWISNGFPELGDTCGMGLGGTVASSVFQVGQDIFCCATHCSLLEMLLH